MANGKETKVSFKVINDLLRSNNQTWIKPIHFTKPQWRHNTQHTDTAIQHNTTRHTTQHNTTPLTQAQETKKKGSTKKYISRSRRQPGRQSHCWAAIILLGKESLGPGAGTEKTGSINIRSIREVVFLQGPKKIAEKIGPAFFTRVSIAQADDSFWGSFDVGVHVILSQCPGNYTHPLYIRWKGELADYSNLIRRLERRNAKSGLVRLLKIKIQELSITFQGQFLIFQGLKITEVQGSAI